MTPRELVYRTLRFEPVPRVPRQMWLLPWAQRHHPDAVEAIRRDFPDDLVASAFAPPRLPHQRGDWHAAGTYVDEWGCEFVNLCDGVIGEVKDPIVRDYASDLHRVRPPYEWLDHVDVRRINDARAGTDRFVIGQAGVNPFERMQWLRGTENLYIDLIEQPPGLLRLRDLVHEWGLAMFERFVKTDVDAIAWNDDWGSQRSLLIHPDLWRSVFKPLYADYAALARRHGKFAFMHSDGWITDIYEDLIEIGVHAVNSQLFCMDIGEIGRRFKGRITFWGEIDRQHILPYATEQETRAAVRRVADALYDGHGGVIAQCEFGAGAKPENVRAVFDEWNRIGSAAAPGNAPSRAVV